jgi:hypothetical protein
MAHLQERYPSTFRHPHRTQVMAQIYLPLVLATLLFFIIPTMGLILMPNPLGVGSGQWAAIALIWLLAPFFVLIMLGLVITIALIFLIYRLTVKLPTWTQKVRMWMEQGGILVLNWCNRWVQPVVHAHTIFAMLQRATTLLRHPSEMMRFKSGEQG